MDMKEKLDSNLTDLKESNKAKESEVSDEYPQTLVDFNEECLLLELSTYIKQLHLDTTQQNLSLKVVLNIKDPENSRGTNTKEN